MISEADPPSQGKGSGKSSNSVKPRSSQISVEHTSSPSQVSEPPSTPVPGKRQMHSNTQSSQSIPSSKGTTAGIARSGTEDADQIQNRVAKLEAQMSEVQTSQTAMKQDLTTIKEHQETATSSILAAIAELRSGQSSSSGSGSPEHKKSKRLGGV